LDFVSALNDDTKLSIQILYRDFLSARQLKPRLGQKQMIAGVANILSRIGDEGKAPCGFIEAGTGTGKTLAYLIGALPVALEREMPLVISTATVSLQTQLIEKDIPDLIDATGLSVNWALAKGRRRYLCPIRLESALDAVNEESGLYPDELALVLDSDERMLVDGLSRAWIEGSWAGDMDQVPDQLTDTVRAALTTDHRRCQGRQCRSFQICPYFTARESWLDADLLVVNHDLLMSDLKLGGGVILPPLEKTILIIDEAHQLSRVAANQFTDHVRIAQSLGAIKTIERVLTTVRSVLPESHRIRNEVERVPGSLDLLARQLADWGRQTLEQMQGYPESEFAFQNGGSRYRLRLNDQMSLPEREGEAAVQIINRLQKILDWLKGISVQGGDEISETDAEGLAEQLGLAMGRLESIPLVADRMSRPCIEQGDARWVRVGQDVRYATQDDPTDLEFWVSPMSPAAALKEAIWGRIGACVLTSATLAHQQTFDVQASSLGLMDFSSLIVDGAFDYARQGRLVIPQQSGDPRDELAHPQRVNDYLESRVDSGLGILVLFTSWRLLMRVQELMSEQLREVVLVQGQLTLSSLLDTHETQRRDGYTSILFGLQSMAEGLDLPGDLANEVVITRLPFQPPDDPREATQAEYLKIHGRDPFREMSIPAATIRLRQAVGRLIRSETDTGQVTVLDRRLVDTSWGRSLMSQLPSFRLEM
jgi:ATP-dependent DNA helicase DinG|tara:strand:+ start:4144 stop:6267 length:2124 start_codon:yes stop_codon:yes gene_type:complete